MALTGRRGFLLTSGSALLGAAAVLRSSPAAQAATDPTKPALNVRRAGRKVSPPVATVSQPVIIPVAV